MRHNARRLRLSWTFVLLAWLTQLWLPVAAHAAMANPAGGPMAVWCGTPGNAQEAVAALPAEIRDALEQDAIGPDHLAHCAKLCAVGATPVPLPTTAATAQPPASGPALAPVRQTPVVARQHALPPPSHGPPRAA